MTNPLVVILLAVCSILSLLAAVFGIIVLTKMKKSSSGEAEKKLRAEIGESLTSQRREINERLDSISSALHRDISDGMEKVSGLQSKNMSAVTTQLETRLGAFEKSMSDDSKNLDLRMAELRKSQEDKLESIRKTTEDTLTSLKDSNQAKLNEIENTVREKLDKTLTERVSESFRQVSEQLEAVYKGLGEMQNLAANVGSLKNMLSSVKLRGEFGETQLSRILEQLLSREQYDENVITVKGSGDPVEFAVKIPSKEKGSEFIYLPIDAKFPLDLYNHLIDAYESDDKTVVAAAKKALYDRVKTDAKNIYTKYVNPPVTTDFAIMFLPTEGLFAEVIRDPELTEKLRNDFHITVCGPSTVTAFLNSLQMGFRTLAIEKSSGEVWRILGEVKTEFGKFGDTLEKVKRGLESSSKELDNLVGTRTRAINRKLRDVQEMPVSSGNDFALPEVEE